MSRQSGKNKEQLKEAERGVNQENLSYPTSKNGPKWTYIPFSPLPKIAKCGEVCASQLVPLRNKPREDDNDDDVILFIFFYRDLGISYTSTKSWRGYIFSCNLTVYLSGCQ